MDIPDSIAGVWRSVLPAAPQDTILDFRVEADTLRVRWLVEQPVAKASVDGSGVILEFGGKRLRATYQKEDDSLTLTVEGEAHLQGHRMVLKRERNPVPS